MGRRAAAVLLVATVVLCAMAAAGADVEKVIPDVPSYKWYGGCGPTAGGMVIGYYDAHGYPNLIPGAGNTWYGDPSDWPGGDPSLDPVHAMIASAGYFADWWPTPDRTPPPAYHTDDSVADFMRTSRGSTPQGMTSAGLVDDGLIDYAAYRGYADTQGNYVWFPYLWDLFRQEIDADRPMVFYIDWTGDGGPDHFVAAVGYQYDGDDPTEPQNPQYGCYNTYDHSLHWYDFRPPSSSYGQGVMTGTWFQILGPAMGDADWDGDVDADDYLALKRHLGTGSGATWGQGDFDEDGDVDGDDLLLLEEYFGTTYSVALAGTESVPEPAALGLLALGGLALIRRKRRQWRLSR